MTTPAFMFAGLPLGAQPESLSEDEREILAIEEELATAHSMESLTERWNEDAILFDIGPGDVVGLSNIRPHLAAQYQYVTDIETTILKMRIAASRKIAFAYSIQRITAKGKNGGPDIDWVFRMTDCFEKCRDRWELVHQHVSLPVDLSNNTIITA